MCLAVVCRWIVAANRAVVNQEPGDNRARIEQLTLSLHLPSTASPRGAPDSARAPRPCDADRCIAKEVERFVLMRSVPSSRTSAPSGKVVMEPPHLVVTDQPSLLQRWRQRGLLDELL